MNILHKSVLILIAISIFIFLIFVTFVTNSFSKFNKPFYQIEKQGNYQLINNDKSFTLSKDLKSQTGSLFLNKFNISDKVLYKFGKIKTNKNSNNINIKITPGIYLFQLKEINTKYKIYSDSFDIYNKGPGTFIVNSINSRKIIIFSIDTLLKVNLKNLKNNEEINQIGLFPHMYLVFNPIKNIFAKNADLLKISQIFNLGYFNKKIELSKDFLKLILLKNNKGTEFINNSFKYLDKENVERTKYITDFKKSIFGSLPGESIIKKYNEIFLNPYKKELYYKNLLLRQLYDLINSSKKEYIKINEINDELILLKNINENSYEEIISIINFYYTNVIISNESTTIQKINYSKLLEKINNKNNKLTIPSLIYLEKVFINYGSKTFYQNINNFTKKYFDDLKININGNNINKGNTSDLEDIDYLLYFLENLIINTTGNNINNISFIINIFDNYINIANSFYSYSNQNIKKIGLYTNLDLLNKFSLIINNYYFLKNTDNKLLKINPKAILIDQDILKLEKNINKIFTFFDNNKINLDTKTSTKDKFLVTKLYPNLKEKYIEYFSALKDYDKYLSIYDKSINNILNTKTINENNKTKNILSIEKAKKYIEQFNATDLSSITINIMDYSYCNNPTDKNESMEVKTPFCYKIQNLKINRKIISFILYPYLNNTIDSIKLNNEDKMRVGSYKLDDIKLDMNEKLKTAKKDKETYKFSNFLLNTFGKEKNTDIKNTNIKNTDIKSEKIDTPFIRIFKRNKLLGELGDFNNLKGTIDILYDNINVKRDGKIYNIDINDSKFHIKLNKNKEYIGFFSSNYNFSEKHSFINPKIKIIDKRSNKELLLGNYININGEYSVNNIKQGLENILNNYGNINFIVNNLYNKLNISIIDILYNKDSKIFNISINYNFNKIIINYKNGKIINIISNGKQFIKNNIDIELLDSILNKILNPNKIGEKNDTELK